MRVFAAMVVALVVTGCGGGRVERVDSGLVTRFSTGPISKACMASDRQARNTRLCGCIQTVANQTMSGGDQRKASRFFRDPQRAQDVKMSKTSADDAFWDRYLIFSARAEQSCTGY